MTDILSVESRDFSPARYRQGCENVLDRKEAGRRMTRRGVRGEEGKTTFTTTRSVTSITAGWVDSVPRGFRRAPKRRRLQQGGRAELFRGKRGERVKRLTVCYHGNATPLRQEESLNPARYGPCRLSQYTPSTAFSSPQKSKGRRTTRTTKGLRKGERRREDERRVDGDGGDRITPLTLFLHPSVFTERFRYTGYVA